MIEIREMILRMPGLSAAEGEWLGAEVARLLAGRLPEGAGERYLELLNIRVALPPNTPRNRMAELISTSILRQIRTGMTSGDGQQRTGRPSGNLLPAERRTQNKQ
ncbi:MAG: hypothetical protein KDC75_01340 [Phaeodactylibacter sp.]|nr:hypothetical protein [Phaeodactylibacter sp.]